MNNTTKLIKHIKTLIAKQEVKYNSNRQLQIDKLKIEVFDRDYNIKQMAFVDKMNFEGMSLDTLNKALQNLKLCKQDETLREALQKRINVLTMFKNKI